jgi:hypothetical protein
VAAPRRTAGQPHGRDELLTPYRRGVFAESARPNKCFWPGSSYGLPSYVSFGARVSLPNADAAGPVDLACPSLRRTRRPSVGVVHATTRENASPIRRCTQSLLSPVNSCVEREREREAGLFVCSGITMRYRRARAVTMTGRALHGFGSALLVLSARLPLPSCR